MTACDNSNSVGHKYIGVAANFNHNENIFTFGSMYIVQQ